jgi:hypothetical protein
MASSGMLRRVALVRTDVSKELSASFIKVTRIGELGTTLAVPPKRLFLQEPQGVTSQKTPFSTHNNVFILLCNNNVVTVSA